ncbi:sulfatase [Mariniphaga sp.]|uniref:sulfatase n=1 Tax=Mariniphaga sp. TaxID=1954475 RepID=UPI00356B07BE
MAIKVSFKYYPIFLFIVAGYSLYAQTRNETPNILFIAVDDLRPELACYGHPIVKSPNIDKLAETGLIFMNAYCNVPVCGASRASLLTGVRPANNRFVEYNTYAKEDMPEAVSLPEHFRKNGYHTISNGKVFHHIDDIPESWSETPWNPAVAASSYLDYQTHENLNILERGISRGLPYESADVDDDKYFDGQIATKTITDLQRLKEAGTPFFLAAGFLKPHLPFNAPEKYWNLYSQENIHLPENYYRPENAPDAAIHNFGELRGYYGVPADGPVSNDMAIKLIHGYYACVSYVDAQVGRVLEELDALGLADNTIVILWGDHGWQLGEHSLWCKHANFKTSLHSPLIIRAPGFKQNQISEALTEFVDVFPSLCDLAGLEKLIQLQGESFLPLLENPDVSWKDAVFSRFPLGESIITANYIYTEWIDKKGKSFAEMLYDHRIDSEENHNIANDPAISETIINVRKRLHENINQVENSIN